MPVYGRRGARENWLQGTMIRPWKGLPAGHAVCYRVTAETRYIHHPAHGITYEMPREDAESKVRPTRTTSAQVLAWTPFNAEMNWIGQEEQAGARAAVLEALRLLAGLCDGARRLDGQGFNRLDANRGHYLARLTTLSSYHATAGRKIVRKYRRQLPADLYARLFPTLEPPVLPVVDEANITEREDAAMRLRDVNLETLDLRLDQQAQAAAVERRAEEFAEARRRQIRESAPGETVEVELRLSIAVTDAMRERWLAIPEPCRPPFENFALDFYAETSQEFYGA